MKLLIAIFLTALLSFVAGLFLPWWSIALVAFIIALLIKQTPVRSFVAGFLGLFILWGSLAQWIDIKNQGLLSERIASIIPLGGSSFLLILITAVIGALVAGMGALSGSFLKRSS